MSIWLITGCSSGLGKALAEVVLADGQHVIATARHPEQLTHLTDRYPDHALALALDVTDADQVRDVIEEGRSRLGEIDVLVNNAGYGYRAAVEEGEPEAVQQLFATNFFGPVALIQAVLPGMRARRSGTIINISSIGARRSPAGSGFYSASKAALEAMTASLRKEVQPLGITAMIVEPGAFRTDFSGRSLTQAATAIDDYADTAGRRRKENDATDGTQPGDPTKAAQAILTAAKSDNPPLMLVLGTDAVTQFRTVLDELAADLAGWEPLSTTTDLDARSTS